MIALMDMNAFFASIEQLDRPQWRGRALGVTNGMTGSTIITCSYEARTFGIKTGHKIKQAKQLCPHLIQVSTRPQRYAQVSRRIMQALTNITPDIEIFSVDEAFLDLTHCQHLYHHNPSAIGQRIKKTVFDACGLLCSVGISGDKTTAKWAAKQQKPNGLTIIEPWRAEQALAGQPVTALCGVSNGISKFLAQYGVHNCGDMKNIPISILGSRFGNPGKRIWLMAQGLDPEQLNNEIAAPKSLGHGKVIPPNTKDITVLRTYFLHMAEKLAARLRKHQLEAQHFSISLNTRSGWLRNNYRTVKATDDGQQIFQWCQHFLNNEWSGEGAHQVHVCGLDPKPHSLQNELFTTTKSNKKLHTLIDSVNKRYGEFTLCKAPLLNRSDMPNVIAPAWKPSGHRNTIDE